jgi:hypothetical protein
MGARGPQAQASQGLTVIGGGGIEAVRRPDPPRELTDEMAHEWRMIVNRLPADWFPAETWPMLIQYCTHIVRSRRLRSLVTRMETSSEEFDPVHYARLLDSEQKQTREISNLAVRMRLAQSAIHDRDKKKGPPFKKAEAGALWS